MSSKRAIGIGDELKPVVGTRYAERENIKIF